MVGPFPVKILMDKIREGGGRGSSRGIYIFHVYSINNMDSFFWLAAFAQFLR